MNQRPEACNLIQIFSALTENTLAETLKNFEGKEFRELKEKLSEILVEKISPMGKEISKMLEDKAFLYKTLEEGSQKAKKDAEENLKKIKNIIGFI